MALQKLTLVIGGAASGKTGFAEALVIHAGRARVYLATAEADDPIMRQRIDAHRASRGKSWTTVEEPLEIARALAEVDPEHIVLLDCATLWLANHLRAGRPAGVAAETLLGALAAAAARVLVVTEEIGQGPAPSDSEERAFRDASGALNQALAAEASLVVAVTAGLPQVLKGALPQGFQAGTPR